MPDRKNARDGNRRQDRVDHAALIQQDFLPALQVDRGHHTGDLEIGEGEIADPLLEHAADPRDANERGTVVRRVTVKLRLIGSRENLFDLVHGTAHGIKGSYKPAVTCPRDSFDAKIFLFKLAQYANVCISLGAPSTEC